MYSKYTGIILKKHPLGEADELLTIFTRESGKIRVKAVSSRKIQSKLAGHLQTLNEIEFETAGHLSQSASGGGLPVLVSVRAITFNNYLRDNLKKFACALIGAETLYRLSADRQENQEAYLALIRFLKELGESADERLSLRRLQVQLLQLMGFGFPESGSEQAIRQHLNEVLEREIKSAKFLESLSDYAQ